MLEAMYLLASCFVLPADRLDLLSFLEAKGIYFGASFDNGNLVFIRVICLQVVIVKVLKEISNSLY